MKLLIPLSVIAVLAFSACTSEPAYKMLDPVDYVNTRTGTLSTYRLSTGNTYPAIALPWGTNFWTPQTGKNGDGWTYNYSDNKIRGLKQTHQPSPWINDYGVFSLMPVTKGLIYDENDRASWFSHKAEVAKPYYYKVYLADHDVVAEIAPTERAAAFRLKYPEKDTSFLVLDAYHNGSYVKVLPEKNMIVGYSTFNHGGVPENFKDWFVVVSDTPFTCEYTVTDGSLGENIEAKGDHTLAVVGFKTAKGQIVNLKVASSFISLDQAMQNLEELGGRSFDEIAQAGRDRWNEVLGRIKVEDGNLDNLRTFYSCLYRATLFPRDFSEVDANGKRVHYSPFDGQVHDGYMFTDTGFWDTFRSLFPLMNLVYPDQSVKVQEGLVNDYLESGFLPEWASPGHRGCMVGNNSASVVADAYLKGISGYDVEKLWEAVKHGAHAVHPSVSSTGRLGWDFYDSLGYVPCDVGINESAARTLEYAYDDWCIWRFGKALGKSDDELAPYAKAAMNYKNIFDSKYNLMVGRKEDGSFNEPFNPLEWGGDFTEGNSLHYSWSAFHDVQGLIDLMGGKDSFNAMLDTVFVMPPLYDDSYYGFPIHEIVEMTIMNMGNYAHGNQPIQHMLYLYDWSGQPWKTQARVREVMNKFYNSNFDGYCGDEDNGQTSAWYVFSALGFYPVCPGSNQYAIGTPLFKKATVTRPDGSKITIEADDNSEENFYVKEIEVNGKAWKHNYLNHSDLVKGARIEFELGPDPDMTRGTEAEDAPYSFSQDSDR